MGCFCSQNQVTNGPSSGGSGGSTHVTNHEDFIEEFFLLHRGHLFGCTSVGVASCSWCCMSSSLHLFPLSSFCSVLAASCVRWLFSGLLTSRLSSSGHRGRYAASPRNVNEFSSKKHLSLAINFSFFLLQKVHLTQHGSGACGAPPRVLDSHRTVAAMQGVFFLG